MNNNMLAFYESLKQNSVSVNDLPAWVGQDVIHYIDSENVGEMLGILGRSSGHANLAFWARINAAPDSEDEWRQIEWIGSPIPQDAKDRQLEHFRLVVDIVRKFIGPEQLRRNALFQCKR